LSPAAGSRLLSFPSSTARSGVSSIWTAGRYPEEESCECLFYQYARHKCGFLGSDSSTKRVDFRQGCFGVFKTHPPRCLSQMTVYGLCPATSSQDLIIWSDSTARHAAKGFQTTTAAIAKARIASVKLATAAVLFSSSSR